VKPDTRRCRLWAGIGGSSIVHAVVLTLAFSLALQTNEQAMPRDSAAFRWDVSIITSRPPDPITSDTPTPSPPAPPPRNVVVNAQTPDPSPMVPSHTTITPSVDDMPPQKASHTVNQPARTMMTELGVSSENSSIKSRKHDESAGPVKASRQVLPHNKTSPMPFAHGTEVAVPPQQDPVQSPDPEIRQPTEMARLDVQQRPSAIQRVVYSHQTTPDYGWLVQSLSHKIESLKFYPAIARLKRWEGRVVVQMEVSQNGQINRANVEAGSGYALLDQTALAIIDRASPLELAHPLMAPSVIVSVPLSFQLE